MIAEKIVTVLQGRTPRLLAEEQRRPAAVLVPIQERPDGDHLVLTRRAELLSSHQGQVAFPGGRVDRQDSDPLAAALRESHEEVGIDPRDVRVLGQLDQVTAAANYLVTPFVGVIPFPYAFRLNPAETAAVFSVPISALLDPGRFTADARFFPSHRPNPVYHFHYEGWDIWGATARIITQLLELVYGFEAPNHRH